MLNAIDILNASILIVDDQASNVQLLTQLLQDAAYTRVTSTMNPQEVCALHRAHHYDLILLDLNMPVLDGFQVMEALKADAADDYLPVIVLTAQDHRSQILNREAAIQRLVELIRAAAVTPKKRRPTKPTKASKERRLAVKVRDQRVKRLRGRVRGDE